MNAFHVPAMFVARTPAPVDARFLPLALVDRTAPDAAQRLEEANRWTDTAAPLLAAYLAIYDAHDRAYSTEHQASRDVLLRMYAGNLSDLHGEIEAVRDEALSDASVTAHHVHDRPEAIEIADATNDWLSDEVVSVTAAIDAAFRARRSADEAEANASTRSAWGMA